MGTKDIFLRECGKQQRVKKDVYIAYIENGVLGMDCTYEYWII